eukprot:7388675-Prymnesium_polylepis.1
MVSRPVGPRRPQPQGAIPGPFAALRTHEFCRAPRVPRAAYLCWRWLQQGPEGRREQEGQGEEG